MNPVVKEFSAPYARTDLPELMIGDTLEVGVKIVEGDRERVQRFTGTLIAKNGSGVTKAITVRRIVAGEGVECVFPLSSPRVDSIKVIRHGVVRRGKLYFLRDRVGKGVKLKDRHIKDKKKVAKKAPTEEVKAAEAESEESQTEESQAEE